MSIDSLSKAVADTANAATAVDRAQRGTFSELMLKLLGPIGEEYGQHWPDAAHQRHQQNREYVVRLAALRLGDRIDAVTVLLNNVDIGLTASTKS
jgi:hypothetical protein